MSLPAVIQGVILLLALAAALRDDTPRTKTKWFRWASDVIQPSRDEPLKEARKWHHRPTWHRATARAVVVLLGGETLFGVLTRDTLILVAVIVAVIAAVTVSAYRGYGHVRRWDERQQLVPCRDQIGRITGIKPWQMTVKPDHSRITVPLPYGKHIDAGQRDAVTDTVNLHYPGVEALHGDWSEARGKHPFAAFTRHEPPPLTCAAADILPAIEKAKSHEIVFGLAGGGVPFKRSLDQDCPHLGFSMKSGGGKTTCAKCVGAQILHHGGIVFILDNKWLSHMWFDGLPNVVYAYTAEMIHEALLWLAWDEYQESELTYRKKLGRANTDIEGNVTVDLGPRILVIAEELNSTQRMLKRYWRQIGQKGPSPASEALDELSNAGRQFGMHLLYIGQRLSAKAVSGNGTADARENLGLIVFYNPSKGTWDLLTDGHEKPPDSTVKGRYQIVDASGVTPVQGALWKAKEARDYAMSGTVALPHRDLPFTRHVGSVPGHAISAQSVPESPVQGIVLGHGTRAPHLRTIQEVLVPGGLFDGVTLEAMRQRVKRAKQKGTLKGQGWDGSSELFDQDDLKELVR